MQLCSLISPPNEFMDETTSKIRQKEGESGSGPKDDTQASASVLLGSKQSEIRVINNADKFTMKDQSLINKMKTVSSYRYSNQFPPTSRQPSDLCSVPLAKIDLTMENLDGAQNRYQTRLSNGALGQAKLKNVRQGFGTMNPVDKEN